MRKRLLIPSIAVLLALVLSVPAAASKPVVVQGQDLFLDFIQLPVEHTRGDRCFATATHLHEWTGDISGEVVTDYRTVAEGPCMGAPGYWEETTHIENQFTGTVLGSAEGTIRMTCPGKLYLEPAPRWEFRCVLHSGTGGLANLHGTLQLNWGLDDVGYYWGEVHFDPQ